MRPWFLVAFCLFAGACINTSVERLDHAIRPARSPDSVAFFVEKPSRPYTVIAVIQSNGKSVFDSFDDIRKVMVDEAAKLGGDAVLLGPESTDTNFLLIGTAMVQSDTKTLTAEVIVFDQPPRHLGNP